MNNTYGVRPDGSIEILLTHKAPGSHDVAVINAQDLEVVQKFKGHFYPFKHPRTGKLYARGYYWDPKTKKAQQPLLHRLIARPSRGQNTAHVNGNTLDCTRANLRNLSIGQSIQEVAEQEKAFSESMVGIVKDGYPKGGLDPANIKPNNPNPNIIVQYQEILDSLATLGGDKLTDTLQLLKDVGGIEKGVSFHKVKRRWEVSAFHDGKRYRLGYWEPGALQLANEAVLFFRDQGPEAFNHKYKGGTD